MGEKPRQIAVRLLRRHAEGGAFLEELLERELVGANFSQADRALLHELTFGVVRWQGTLDWLIARKTKGRTQKQGLQVILRLGLYQLFWLQRIPDHAAVHESVELARQSGFGAQAGFVNAVLRSYLRERDQTRKALDDLKTTDPAVGYSHPEWLVGRWQTRWKPDQLERLLGWNNMPPPTYARLNTLRSTAEELVAQWQQEGVEAVARKYDWVQEGLVYELKSFPPLTGLRSVSEGRFYIQDPSTLLAVTALDPKPGNHILDLCAAPGGKTTLIAQLISNQGSIIAQEPHPGRREMLRENCARLSANCVQVEPVSPPESPSFDRVLVDAPCSNTGVIRRRVDLRWRVRAEEIDRLRQTQLDLLNSAAIGLRPGGKLVYSTCSLEPEENEQVTQRFLESNPSFRLDFERTLLPFTDGVDGAYVARLIRNT